MVRAERAIIEIASKKLLLVVSTKSHLIVLNYAVDLAVFDVVFFTGKHGKVLDGLVDWRRCGV